MFSELDIVSWLKQNWFLIFSSYDSSMLANTPSNDRAIHWMVQVINQWNMSSWTKHINNTAIKGVDWNIKLVCINSLVI